MGRPSSLTDAQWEKIGKRLLAGEKAAALSREFGVSKASISQRFSKRIETVKAVAHQIVATDEAFSKLNVSEQFAARSYSEMLKATRSNMLGVSASLSGVANMAASLANTQFQKVDEADPFSEEGVKTLKGVGALLNIINQSSEVPMAVIKASKEFTDEGGGQGKPGADGIPHTPEYALAPDEPVPARPIL